MLRIFGKKYPLRKLILFFGEGIFLFGSLTLITILREPVATWDSPLTWLRLVFIVVTCLLCLYYFDLYTFKKGYSYFEMTTRLFQALGSASIFLGLTYFLFPVLMPGRGVFLTELVTFILFSSIWRYFYVWILKRDIGSKPAVILGQGNAVERLLEELEANSDCGYKITGIIYPQNPGVPLPSNPDAKISYGFENILDQARELKAEEIIVAMDERRGMLPIDELLKCKMQGLPVIDGETFIEEVTGKLAIDSINPSWLIFKEGFQKTPSMLLGKRISGILFSLAGLIFSLPVTLITAAAIKLESRGPVFFRQTRVGKDGIEFQVIKFRSMRTDAEKDGAKWASADDDRVTRVGRIIRKLRIDEIPQMWNVLKGDMNFVGPRPERPEFVKDLAQKIRYYDQRHCVHPGITGWAQINYPYGASIEDAKRKLEYDLYYIKHMSVLLDFYIVLKTVKTILFREGSR